MRRYNRKKIYIFALLLLLSCSFYACQSKDKQQEQDVTVELAGEETNALAVSANTMLQVESNDALQFTIATSSDNGDNDQQNTPNSAAGSVTLKSNTSEKEAAENNVRPLQTIADTSTTAALAATSVNELSVPKATESLITQVALDDLEALPSRKLIYIVRQENIERNLIAAINEERLKVDLDVYKDNALLDNSLLEQGRYNLQHLLPENFSSSSNYVLAFCYQTKDELNERAIEEYFHERLLEERDNLILMLGDGMDELSLVLLSSQREGDLYPYHYLLLALPWQSQSNLRFDIKYLEPQVNLIGNYDN